MARPGPVRVLVVDDHKDTADSTAQLLALSGHEARVAYTGADAVEAADAFRPDVVLLDIGLPDFDGYAVARTLRATATRVPVLIAVTGHAHLASHSCREGVAHHLEKPVDPVRLVALIAELADLLSPAG